QRPRCTHTGLRARTLRLRQYGTAALTVFSPSTRDDNVASNEPHVHLRGTDAQTNSPSRDPKRESSGNLRRMCPVLSIQSTRPSWRRLDQSLRGLLCRSHGDDAHLSRHMLFTNKGDE